MRLSALLVIGIYFFEPKAFKGISISGCNDHAPHREDLICRAGTHLYYRFKKLSYTAARVFL